MRWSACERRGRGIDRARAWRYAAVPRFRRAPRVPMPFVQWRGITVPAASYRPAGTVIPRHCTNGIGTRGARNRAQLRNARLERDRFRDLAAGRPPRRQRPGGGQLWLTAARLRNRSRECQGCGAKTLQIARDALSNMTIRARFAAVVASKRTHNRVRSYRRYLRGSRLRARYLHVDSLEIEVDVNEAYAKSARRQGRVGNTTTHTPSARPSKVIAIVPTADPRQKATVKVRIGFLERDPRVSSATWAEALFSALMRRTEL